MSSDRVMTLGAWPRPADMPERLAVEVAGWANLSRSPSGGAFYSQSGEPWRSPEEGCLRAATVWNRAVEGENGPRFPTDAPLPPRCDWAIARWTAGVWALITGDQDDPRVVRERRKDRVDRLVASRRWTRSDLEVLQALLGSDALARSSLLATDPGRERSLKSLTALRLVQIVTTEDSETPDAARRILSQVGGNGTDAAVWLDEDAQAIAAEVVAWQAKRHARAESRQGRHAQAREQEEDVKASIAMAVRNVFPAMPAEVAASAAARLAPSVAKLGRRPGTQGIVDAVVEIRLERWRQAIASDPEVEARLLAMQARGANGRVRKRFRDQRAAERVEAEIRDWRGDLEPVTSHRLGG
ncbi:hypothetical protein [Azospirillum griseum]|nr:hypothetical protein [Azospirillum griseum]